LHVLRSNAQGTHAQGTHAQGTQTHLGEVPQVERVVRLRGDRAQRRRHLVIQHDGRLHQGLDALAHLARGALDEAAKDAAEDGAQRARRRLREGNYVVVAHEARRERVAPAARRSACAHEGHVYHVLPKGLAAVVEAPAVDQQPQELDGRRGAIGLESGHVDVVHEEREALAGRGAEHGPPPLVEPLLDHRLRRSGRRLRREVELHGEPRPGPGELGEDALREDALADARAAADQGRDPRLEVGREQERRAHRVHRRHEHLKKGRRRRVDERGHQ
jgi:hypothetical protein